MFLNPCHLPRHYCNLPRFSGLPGADIPFGWIFPLSNTEPKIIYDVGDWELLAIKVALEEWRYLLEDAAHPIIIFTDHINLEYLRSAKCPISWQTQWALFFSKFNFHLTYCPGSKYGKADALLRMFSETPETVTLSTILSPQNFPLIQPELRTTLQQTSTQCADTKISAFRKQ